MRRCADGFKFFFGRWRRRRDTIEFIVWEKHAAENALQMTILFFRISL